MNTNFTSLTFSTRPLHESAYELTLNFSGQNETLARTFNFTASSAPEETVLDIFTKNGVCQNFSFYAPFTNEEREEARSASSLIAQYPTALQKVAVFDLRDKRKRYAKKEPLQEAEKKVVELFQNPEVKRLIPASHLLCEASLKHDLLHLVSPKEAEFLNSSLSGISFCVCAEYFMTAMKIGSSLRELNPQNYFKSLGASEFKAAKTSTTFYPELYKTKYASDSVFANSIKPVYDVTGSYNTQFNITTLNVARKG